MNNFKNAYLEDFLRKCFLNKFQRDEFEQRKAAAEASRLSKRTQQKALSSHGRQLGQA